MRRISNITLPVYFAYHLQYFPSTFLNSVAVLFVFGCDQHVCLPPDNEQKNCCLSITPVSSTSFPGFLFYAPSLLHVTLQILEDSLFAVAEGMLSRCFVTECQSCPLSYCIAQYIASPPRQQKKRILQNLEGHVISRYQGFL